MQQELIPHLFRAEFGKITAVLCKQFGFEHIETAEDIAGETFLAALENWTYKGLPENPTAWLYTVAKNKAKNHFNRNKLFQDKVTGQLDQPDESHQPEIDLSDTNITDSQLQMLFAICHPSIPPEAQIGLALRILCGFSIDEITSAFLSNKETINKRLFRAKEKLREQQIDISFPHANELPERLDAVLLTLYLLYNEGYYSENNDAVLREELCYEAMRLIDLLTKSAKTTEPRVHALYALMCFQASRFPARKNDQGEAVLYHDQDEALWDKGLITRGAYHISLAAQGGQLSKYHLEASIAYWNTIKEDTTEKWENILQLYNRLLQIAYSPVAALNRTYALSKARGKEAAIIEAEKLKLTNNQFYYTLLSDLYTGIDNHIALLHLETARKLAKTQADKQLIGRKIAALK